jgi:hypothetical protein
VSVLAAIEWNKIGELVWVGLVAALVITATFALLIMGVSRATECRRDGSGAAAVLYGGIAVVAGLAFVGAVAYGVQIITTK